MDAEYKRLEAEAREVEHQIQELIKSPVTRTPEHIPAEQQLTELHIKLGSLRQGMMLIRSVNSAAMQKSVRRFVEALSHRFYSQGCRKKTVQLPGGVTPVPRTLCSWLLPCRSSLRRSSSGSGHPFPRTLRQCRYRSVFPPRDHSRKSFAKRRARLTGLRDGPPDR